MKGFFKSSTGVIILVAVILAVVLIGIILWVVIAGNKGTYRNVQVYQVDGHAEVYRGDKDPVEPYANMRLVNQDRVKTMTNCYLYMKMDGDKYMMAEPETEFSLEAAGTSRNSRTRISLASGSVVTHVTKPLSTEAVYEVITPTSTMAVRGTSFRVYVWTDDEGVIHVAIQIMDGSVEVNLIQPDGSVNTDTVTVDGGQTALIYQDETHTDFETILDTVDYMELDLETLEFLGIALEHGKKLSIGDRELAELIALKSTVFRVVFLSPYGTEFASQEVYYGKKATPPMMTPTVKGHWDYDFTKPIKDDVKIRWVVE